MGAPKEEQRGVARFLTAEGVSQQEIIRRMTAVYGEHCISLATVKRWRKRLRERRETFEFTTPKESKGCHFRGKGAIDIFSIVRGYY
jgi:transposase